MKNNKFSKTPIAASLSLILGTMAMNPLYAAESDTETGEEQDAGEVVLITGIRGSLMSSMNKKRDAIGVVDAITAEDIGKFPDTNLAESLQRISGVSINRQNGEGSQVTVRGFGPQFNMVTLNGRTMPGSSLPSGGGASDTRAFSFENLSSDAVQSIEVFKTGKANIASGGMGSTINIVTAKPLDNPDFVASVGATLVHDTTVFEGSDVTPEVSGIVSWANPEKTFGMSLNASFSERDSGVAGATIDQWRSSPWDGTVPDIDPNNPTVFTNEPAIGDTHALPSNLIYYMADRERERTNAQLTMQFKPKSNMTATLDYTYANLDQNEERSELSIWYAEYKSALTFDNGVSRTPIIYREDRFDLAPRDIAVAQINQNAETVTDSIGFNFEWDVNDRFRLAFDYHDSSAETTPTQGYGNFLKVGLGANVVAAQGANYNNGLPTMIVEFDDCDPRIGLNCNNQFDQDDVGTSIQQRAFSENYSDIQQTRIDGTFDFDDFSVDFGIEMRDMSNHTIQSNINDTMGNWGVENPGELPAGFLTPVNFANVYSDYSTAGAWTQGFRGDAAMIGAWAANLYGFAFNRNPDEQTNRLIEEEVTSVYTQFRFEGDWNRKPYNLVIGFRYEDTTSKSTANIAIPQEVLWESNNDFRVIAGSSDNKENYTLSNDYDHFLPNLDFDIELAEDVIARFSYSKTIARPSFGNLSSAATVTGGPSTPTILGNAQPGSATSGNPALVPLESENFDLSAEYYFDESSYFSIGYYLKDVSNFIGTAPIVQNFYGLRDPSAGPRAQQAIADLQAIGETVNETNLFSMMAANQLGVDYFSMTANEFEAAVDISANADDPLMQFLYQAPVNNKEAQIDGFEIAVQHFFGESGFGIQANYTTVDGDVGFDLSAAPDVTQFALQGLSDTANVVFMYEKFGWNARLSYNWRDDFLNSAARYASEPGFVEEYSQVDLSVGYEFNEDLTIQFEGINLTEENFRVHGRTSVQMWNLEEYGARYSLGVRYSF
ncbi:TonB-dependent receptor [Aliikangiella marina]|uniref:TonB-dependent receptor n=1 Tax=Aliikangiella marina TaxID=1712262 RepID=A0A545T192_9GAMM|nr:TonB-dependent receptor [Aliikangiella marina]TQV70980.1 TonB-dependent receptor [Aliikangiella marina]